MAATLITYYPSRHNRDGSYDSICLKCFATVFSATTARGLIEPNQRLICNSSDMFQRAFDRTLAQR
jgi:hypothetical protein